MPMSTQLSSSGAVPKAQVLTPSAGVLSSLQGLTLPSTQTSPQKQSTVPSIGTNPGLLPGVNTSSQQKTVTTNVDGSSTTTHPAQSNPSVLAQQQALNKLGAGLVEDGIAGPKTSAAIAKYGIGTTTSTNTSTEPTKPTTPQVGTASQNAQTTLNSGNQTQNEQQTQAGLLAAGQKSPDQQAALQAVQYGLGVQNNNNFGQYAEAGMLGTDPQAYVNEANAPDLAGRASATRGLANQYANLYGTQANAALNEANTIAGQGLTAAGGAYSGAQNQASRATGAAENVQGASLNQQGTYSAPTFNPLTGQYSSSGNYGTGPEAQSNVQGVKDAQNVINSITSNTPAITTNLQRANDLAAQAKLDPNSPLLTGLQHAISTGLVTNQALTAFNSAITALNQNLTEAGQAPIDPATITPSALAQLTQTIPNNLKVTQQSKQQFIDSFNKDSSSNSSSGGSTGGSMFGSFFGK